LLLCFITPRINREVYVIRVGRIKYVSFEGKSSAIVGGRGERWSEDHGDLGVKTTSWVNGERYYVIGGCHVWESYFITAHLPTEEVRIIRTRSQLNLLFLLSSDVVPLLPAKRLKRTQPLSHQVGRVCRICAKPKGALTLVLDIRWTTGTTGHGLIRGTINVVVSDAKVYTVKGIVNLGVYCLCANKKRKN